MGTSDPRPFAVPAKAPIDPPETPNTNLVTARPRDGKHRPVLRNARRAAASSEFALMLLVEG
jgi:hypothetical protein